MTNNKSGHVVWSSFDEYINGRNRVVLKFTFLCNLTENVGYINVLMELCFSNRSDTWFASNNLLHNSDWMCFVLKEIVVYSCCMLFDFFRKIYNLPGNIM